MKIDCHTFLDTKILTVEDLLIKMDREGIESLFPGQEMLEISATEEINLEKLKERIAEFALNDVAFSPSDSLILNIRQEQALEQARQNVERAFLGIRGKVSEELTAYDLRKAVDRLGEITGEVVTEEILGDIFSHFCIGK